MVHDPLVRGILLMMRQFGGLATLVVDTGNEQYDYETSKTIKSIQEYPIKVIAQDYIQKAAGITTTAGGLVKTGDKQFFIVPDETVPAPRTGVDHIIFEGKKWTPIAFKDYNPSGVKSYLYEVYARH